jgi:hypothetical protein
MKRQEYEELKDAVLEEGAGVFLLGPSLEKIKDTKFQSLLIDIHQAYDKMDKYLMQEEKNHSNNKKKQRKKNN